MKYVTESDIPFKEAFYMPDRFVLLNMCPDGVWYVDIQHPEWANIKQTAINVAKTFGDTAGVNKLQLLK